jgi:hypothetical protein
MWVSSRAKVCLPGEELGNVSIVLLLTFSCCGGNMATQPIQKQNERPAVPMAKDATWQILAKEAAEEKDPEKLMQIIRALTEALDENDRKSA